MTAKLIVIIVSIGFSCFSLGWNLCRMACSLAEWNSAHKGDDEGDNADDQGGESNADSNSI